MLITKIKATIDYDRAQHPKPGEETKYVCRMVTAYCKDQCNNPIYIGSPTQLLALDLICNKLGLELKIYNSTGDKFKEIAEAHRYVNDEYIFLDLVGTESYTDIEKLKKEISGGDVSEKGELELL